MKSDTVELFKWPSYPGQSWTPDAGPSCAPVDIYEGSFIRAGVRHDRGMPLSHEQLQAIVVGLPWERLDERAKIRVL